jgi:peptidoglycan/LPS O-acetylase OafA/YrhL
VLDGLRGAAMLLVFINHAIDAPFGLEPAATRVDAFVRAIAQAGWIGVDLFFVLSGFLITGILLDTQGQPRWWPNFFARRALRVFPLYYGVLTVAFVLLPRMVSWAEPAFATLQANQGWYWGYTVNLLTALTHGQGTPLNTTHFWSLSIEEQFYLVWPLVVWACKPRVLLRAIALTMIAGLAFRLGLVLLDPANNARLAFYLTPGRLDSLMTGAALAVVARAPGGLPRVQTFAPLVCGACVIALSALAILRGGLYHQDPVVVIAGLPLVALLFGALLVMALTASRTSRLGRWLSSASLGKWGKYSYGIYIIHFPLLGAMEYKTAFYRHGVALLGGSQLPGVLLLAAVAMVTSYALSKVSYHVYEKRFLDLKRYFGPDTALRNTAPLGTTPAAGS